MSCLFISLGTAIGVDSTTLRANICDFLCSDPVLYDGIRVSMLLDDCETPSVLEDYVACMRSPNTWGSALEIECFCRMYRRRVTVKIETTGRKTSFGDFTDTRMPPIALRWDGGHYELD